MSDPKGYGFNPTKLKQIRNERGLSQRQLAKASGVLRMGIVRYEQGTAQPRMENVQALARELGIDPKTFFEWDASGQETLATRPAPMRLKTRKDTGVAEPDVKLLKKLDRRLHILQDTLSGQISILSKRLKRIEGQLSMAINSGSKEG